MRKREYYVTKIHEDRDRFIRELYKEKKSLSHVARLFSLSRQRVSQIVTAKDKK